MQVEETQIDLLAGDDPQAREVAMRRVAELKEQLADESPTPLEQLLVDRVVCCWLAVAHAELMQQHTARLDQGQLQHYERRLDRANRRFCFAVRQLQIFQRTAAKQMRKDTP